LRTCSASTSARACARSLSSFTCCFSPCTSAIRAAQASASAGSSRATSACCLARGLGSSCRCESRPPTPPAPELEVEYSCRSCERAALSEAAIARERGESAGGAQPASRCRGNSPCRFGQFAPPRANEDGEEPETEPGELRLRRSSAWLTSTCTLECVSCTECGCDSETHDLAIGARGEW